MNGAESLIQTLSQSGVQVCFANPGTSEMQLVAALDSQPEMRAVLGLFEGVVTGAADGYGRMADKPAATLLHLGPGLANGGANLHNAKRARAPIVNIVGDHATYHIQYDAPLTSDLKGIAAPFSNWLDVSSSADDLSVKGAAAIEASLTYPGQVATLMAPANHAWEEANDTPAIAKPPAPPQANAGAIKDSAAALKGEGTKALYLGGMALREGALEQAGRIAAACGARLVCETFPARLQRGAGRVPVERLPYFGELAQDFLKDFAQIVIVGTKPPVSFFAYPGKPSTLMPDKANIVTLATPREEALSALTKLAEALDAPAEPAARQASMIMPAEPGPLNPVNIAALIAKHMPENSIIADESNTAGLAIFPITAGAPKHDLLTLTGGSIGMGLPLATGAAIACPGRKTICLQADGSAMYTVQALWTMAREELDITTIIFNNGSYAILNIELARVGVSNPGKAALSLLDLTNPPINWVSISEGMGVPAVRATTAEEFETALTDAIAHKGPRLIEAILPVPGA